MTQLTTHVLDLVRGLPATGMRVVVRRLDGDGTPGPPLREVRTDDDGRTGGPLLADVDGGRYELTFSVAEYFGGGEATPYLDEVPIRIGVPAEAGRIHVALLVTPWSYTTYRGS